MSNQKGKTNSPPKMPNHSNLLMTVQRILDTPSFPLNKSLMTLKNALTLSSFDFSIESMIKSNEFTSLHSGCEFRNVETICPILQLHHYGAEVEKYLLSGVSYDLDPGKVYTESDPN